MKSILLFMGIGMEEMLVIGLVVLVFFGADKVPEFMKGLGKGVREFKNGLNKIQGADDEPEQKAEAPKTLPTTKEPDPDINQD
jgi:sec-independent protein translocase protein TatA